MSDRKRVSFTGDSPAVFEYEQTELPAEEVKKKEQSQERKDWFMDYMAISMGIRSPEQVLDEVSFEGVANYIKSGKCSNIITMAGAGISTSADLPDDLNPHTSLFDAIRDEHPEARSMIEVFNIQTIFVSDVSSRIPDYRSPGTGLFDLLKDKYPSVQRVEDLFNIQFFMKDPKPFFERSKRFFEISLKPTPCHYFVRLLHEKGMLLRHYTQNIDTLDRLAGLPADKVVEAHGSYYTAHCLDCDAEYSFLWMENKVLAEEIPRCEEEDCNGVVKPDIVLFGESLSTNFGELAEEDTLKCDLLIVMGTALAVQPFASLTSKVKSSTPRVYINLDRGKTAKKHPVSDIMFGGGFDFDSEDNYRDIFKQEKCDDACYHMADILGWGEELRSLVTKEHARIDAEDKARGKKIPPPPSTESKPATTTASSTPRDAKPTGATNNKRSNTGSSKTATSSGDGNKPAANSRLSTTKTDVKQGAGGSKVKGGAPGAASASSKTPAGAKNSGPGKGKQSSGTAASAKAKSGAGEK